MIISRIIQDVQERLSPNDDTIGLEIDQDLYLFYAESTAVEKYCIDELCNILTGKKFSYYL